ncbi:DUF6368 family protein [Streptomyces niveus]
MTDVGLSWSFSWDPASATRPSSRPSTPTKSTRGPLIGFTPTHAVEVIAFRNRPVDHVVTALLTAAVMDVIGGIANAELREHQVPIVAGLPGIVAAPTDPWPAAYGSAEFLRAWARQPGFRLLK